VEPGAEESRSVQRSTPTVSRVAPTFGLTNAWHWSRRRTCWRSSSRWTGSRRRRWRLRSTSGGVSQWCGERAVLLWRAAPARHVQSRWRGCGWMICGLGARFTGEDVEPRQRYEGVKFRPMRGRPSKLYASVVRTRRPVTAAGSEPIIPYSSEDV